MRWSFHFFAFTGLMARSPRVNVHSSCCDTFSSPGIAYEYCLSVGRGFESTLTRYSSLTLRESLRETKNALESGDQSTFGRTRGSRERS